MQEDAKYTPGPWSFSETSGHGTRLIYGADRYLVADAGRIPKRSDEEATANARLISAAPDLLAALDDLAELVETNMVTGEVVSDAWAEALSTAVAAINKAKGAA